MKEYTIYIVTGILLAPFILYFLSRIQMKGWYHEFHKQLTSKSNILKKEENDKEK